MHISFLLAGLWATSVLAGVVTPLDKRESCSTPEGSGTCMSTSSCTGFSVAGYCSGGASNQCCISKTCSTPSGSGTCKSTSSCSGTSVSGYCPGSSSIQCCVSNSCSTPDGSGTCKSTSSCTGFSVAGYCPGSSSNQCCISKTCSTSSGSGTCLNTSKGCSGGSFHSGACPGDSSIECCVKGSSGGGGGSGDLPGLGSAQSSHARAIIAEAKSEGVGRQGCLAAITTGLTESSIYVYANNAVPSSLNYPYDKIGSDYDSIGIFQQRASIYTNIAADMDPARSAAQFFTGMKAISGWQTMNVGDLCQAVQKSAYPDRYEANVPAAESICTAGGIS